MVSLHKVYNSPRSWPVCICVCVGGGLRLRGSHFVIKERFALATAWIRATMLCQPHASFLKGIETISRISSGFWEMAFQPYKSKAVGFQTMLLFLTMGKAITCTVFLLLTIVSDIWDLEASGTVGFTRFEVDPQFPRPCSEGYGPLVSLTCLIRCDGRRRGYTGEQTISSLESV